MIEKQRRSRPTPDVRFGNEHVKTKVFMMAPASEPVLEVNVEDYMEAGTDGSEAWIVDDPGLG